MKIKDAKNNIVEVNDQILKIVESLYESRKNKQNDDEI